MRQKDRERRIEGNKEREKEITNSKHQIPNNKKKQSNEKIFKPNQTEPDDE